MIAAELVRQAELGALTVGGHLGGGMQMGVRLDVTAEAGPGFNSAALFSRSLKDHVGRGLPGVTPGTWGQRRGPAG